MNHMSEEAMAERHFGPKNHQALKGENATFRGPGDNDVIQNDMRHLMNVLGMSTHARPVTPHDVFVSEIIPKVEALKRENERLREFVATVGNIGEEAYALLPTEEEENE